MKRGETRNGTYLGYLDGPPIGPCAERDRLRANAIAGSKRLASTINFLGLRP